MLRFIESIRTIGTAVIFLCVVCVAVVFLQSHGSVESRAYSAGSWLHRTAVSTVVATRSFVTGVAHGITGKSSHKAATRMPATTGTSTPTAHLAAPATLTALPTADPSPLVPLEAPSNEEAAPKVPLMVADAQ